MIVYKAKLSAKGRQFICSKKKSELYFGFTLNTFVCTFNSCISIPYDLKRKASAWDSTSREPPLLKRSSEDPLCKNQGRHGKQR